MGLRGRMRKVWATRGVPVPREVQIGWPYTYVAVAIDPMTGRLWYARQKHYEERDEGPHGGAWTAEPGIDGWIRDGAGDHTEAEMQAVVRSRVVQRPCAPEPNPGECFVQELRQLVEGWAHSGPAGQNGCAGTAPEGLVGRPEAGAATVWLGLDPGIPETLPTGHASIPIMQDWYDRGSCLYSG